MVTPLPRVPREPRPGPSNGHHTSLDDQDGSCSGLACAANAACALEDIFKLLGRAHLLDILYLFLHEDGARRFGEVQDALGISPNTLTARLKDLVQAGLLTRTSYNEIPPRVDYEATQKAHELRPVFRSLIDWCARNKLEADASPVAMA